LPLPEPPKDFSLRLFAEIIRQNRVTRAVLLRAAINASGSGGSTTQDRYVL
jgi:hypothetical protein